MEVGNQEEKLSDNQAMQYSAYWLMTVKHSFSMIQQV